MRAFLDKLRDVAITGFLFLLPVIVVFVLITKAWTSLASVGSGIAGLFGLKSILGIGGTTVFTGLLLIAICLACGLLVRVSFMAALSQAMERALSKYIPAYDTYKAMAEEKLQNRRAMPSYTTALVKQHDCWQPAYVIERDQDGNHVLFVPDIPETSRGHVLVAPAEQVRIVASVTASQLDASLKKLGKGLLSDLRIQKDEWPAAGRRA